MSIDISNIKTQHSSKSKKMTLKPFLDANLFTKQNLQDKNKTKLYKDLAVLLKANIDFKTALIIIRDQQKKEKIRVIIDCILEDVIQGKSLNKAIEKTNLFSPYEVYSIEIGENTKKLDLIFVELHNFFERKIKLKKQIVSILTYPAFIILLTLATLYFMLTYVVPMFETVFRQFDKKLPTITSYIITLSDNFKLITITLIIILIVIVLLYNKVRKKERFRKISSLLILKIPFISKLVKEIYLTRFCQSMSLLLFSKTSLVGSLNLVEKMIGFYPLENTLHIVSEDIKKGISLGESMSKFKIFDHSLVSMIIVAEKVNQLDSMFLNLAKQYDQEVEHKTKVMGTIIEPLLILFIGGIVGVIMIAMYAPMFDLSKVIGNG